MGRLIWIYGVCPLVFDFFNKIQFSVLKVFKKSADVILSSALLELYR